MKVNGFTIAENAQMVKGNNPAHGFQNRAKVHNDAARTKLEIAVGGSGLQRKPFSDIGRSLGDKHSARAYSAHLDAGYQPERRPNQCVDFGLYVGIVVCDVAKHAYL